MILRGFVASRRWRWLSSGHKLVSADLLQLEQLGEQNWFIAAWASASQPEGMAKQPAVCTTALAEPTLAA
jgi:hypothetical protein